MARIVFTNVAVFDGTGAKPYPGEVAVADKRIAARIAGCSPMPR